MFECLKRSHFVLKQLRPFSGKYFLLGSKLNDPPHALHTVCKSLDWLSAQVTNQKHALRDERKTFIFNGM